MNRTRPPTGSAPRVAVVCDGATDTDVALQLVKTAAAMIKPIAELLTPCARVIRSAILVASAKLTTSINNPA